MPIEIERKYLVTGEDWKELAAPILYAQGYLAADKERTVRIRIAGEKGFLTIKGKTQGIGRMEFEYEIPLKDAEEMLKLCENPPVVKYRRKILFENKIWEVDEFLEMNQGLVLAEVELEHEDEEVVLPPWTGKEVSHDYRYFNAYLSKFPFKSWKKED